MSIRHKLTLISALIFLSCFAITGQTEPRKLIIYEPFGMLSVLIQFKESTYDLPNTEREKLLSFGQKIAEGTLLPMHECDFDVFTIEGFRDAESPEDRVLIDDLFAKRVRRIRDVLTSLGIPEGAGYTVKPSENRPMAKEENNSVFINVRYWLHHENEKIDPAHVKCKFGHGLR